MILTVTLNAAVDKTYRVENFTLDRVHRPSEWRVVAGGKGVNVARVYQTLGGRAIATGYLGGYNGRFVARSLAEEGIASSFVRTREESRACIAIVDPVANTQTELNEVGPNVRPSEVRALRRTFAGLLSEHRFDYVTLSGSMPPGVPVGLYAEMIAMARAAGVRCILDASGEALRQGLAARPWMVKPNLFEMRQACGREVEAFSEIAAAAHELRGTGIEIVCVTLGKQGCICAAENLTIRAEPPEIRFVSAVGSGDSFLAAFLWALGKRDSFSDAVRLAVGAGAANAADYGAGFCSAEEIYRLASAVSLTEYEAKEGVEGV